MNRGLFSVCAAVAVLLTVGCGGDTDDETLDAGSAEEFEVGVPVHFESANVYVVETGAGDFMAFFDHDPRTGCILQFPGYGSSELVRPELRRYGFFREGCHGSAYDIEGERTFGPSAFDLTEYPVEVRDGRVVVSLHSPQCYLGGDEEERTAGCVITVLDEAPVARTPLPS